MTEKTNQIEATELDDPRFAEAIEECLAALESGKIPDRRSLLARYRIWLRPPAAFRARGVRTRNLLE